MKLTIAIGLLTFVSSSFGLNLNHEYTMDDLLGIQDEFLTGLDANND